MNYLTREAWGSAFDRGGYVISGPLAEVYLHHWNSGIAPERTPADAIVRVRNGQRYHAVTNGWGDIGYSWCVADDGTVLEGRGWGRTGAHTYGFNSKGYGIVWLGDSNVSTPSDAALRSIADVILWGIRLGWIDAHPTIVAHRDRVPDTSCCGDPMYLQLPAIRQLVASGGSAFAPATTTPPAREDEDMAVIIRINEPGSPFNGVLYATDGVSKVFIPTMEVANELLATGVVKRQPDGAGWVNVSLAAARVPMTVDEWSLAAMPGRVADAVAAKLAPPATN